MSTTFSLDREAIVRKVLGKLGVLDPNETTKPEDSEAVGDAIDLRLKELHALGVLWFGVGGAQTSVSLTASTATASAPADFLFPVSMMLVVGNEQDPIEIIGHRQYQAIQDKGAAGQPDKAFFHGSTIRLHPVPSSDMTAKLTYQAIADDSAQATDLDLGAGMQRAFIDLVAGDLIDDYQVSGEHAARLMARQSQALVVLRTLNAQRIDTETVSPNWY